MEEPNILESEPPDDNNGQTADETEEAAMEIVKNDEVAPARLGIRGFDDEHEETIRLSVEEAHNYILAEVGANLRDSQINPLLNLKNRIETIKATIEEQLREIYVMTKMFEILCQDQEKCLRLIPKVEKRTIGVSVNFPFSPELALSDISTEDSFDQTGNDIVLMQPTIQASSKVPKNTSNIECIDLTDDADDPGPSISTSATAESTAELAATASSAVSCFALTSTDDHTNCITAKRKTLQHPVPLPAVPDGKEDASKAPLKPRLKISIDEKGIVLTWNLPPDAKDMKIMGFEIFGYQEKNNVPISSALWNRIGCIDPLPLPMSCTLTHFREGFKYHFSVRAVCKDGSFGPFSDPASIMSCLK